MSVPIPHLNEMLHENEGLLIDKLYPRLFQKYQLKEQFHTREGARSVILRFLILGAIKTSKDAVFIP